MIPNIAHFIWIGSPLPDWGRRTMDEFTRLNPDMEVTLHTKGGSVEAIRAEVLEQEGGWYFDMDWVFFHGLGYVFKNTELDPEAYKIKQNIIKELEGRMMFGLAGKEPGMFGLGCPPHHPAWAELEHRPFAEIVRAHEEPGRPGVYRDWFYPLPKHNLQPRSVLKYWCDFHHDEDNCPVCAPPRGSQRISLPPKCPLALPTVQTTATELWTLFGVHLGMRGQGANMTLEQIVQQRIDELEGTVIDPDDYEARSKPRYTRIRGKQRP